MQTFTSPLLVKLKFLGVIAVYAGLPAFFILMPNRGTTRHNSALPWAEFILAAFFSLPVLYSLIGLRNANAAYQLDDDGITKRERGKATHLRWQDISGYELSSSKNALTLWDAQGQRMCVVFNSAITNYGLRDANGLWLRDALNERLNPIAAQMQQDAQQGQEFRYGFRSPVGGLTIVFPIVALLMVGFLRFGLLTPAASAGDRVACYGLCAFFVFGALFLTAYGLPLLLSVFTVTEEAITHRLPWKTVTIPFERMHTFAVNVSAKDTASVTLRGDDEAIQFTSLLPNYALLIEFIRAHVPAEVLNNQASAQAEMERKQARSMAWQMPIVGIMLGFLFGLLGWMFLKDGTERLETYRILAAQGQTTLARVTDTYQKGRNEPRYSVEYTLDLGGKHYDGTSYVPQWDYEQARNTGHIPVVYLPANPATKHAVASLGKPKAQEMVQNGHVMLSVAVSLPFVFGVGAFIAYKRKYTSTAAMRRLEQIETP